MSLSASCESTVCQKRTLSSLLADRVIKRPKQDDLRQLQEAAIQLLNQNQNLASLLREVGSSTPSNVVGEEEEKATVAEASPRGLVPATTGSLLVSELRRQAQQQGVPVVALSVRLVLDRLTEMTLGGAVMEDCRALLTSSQRNHLDVLLQSTRELLFLGAFCPKLFWQEYWKDQKQPKLEVIHHLHSYNILTFKYILESDDRVGSWLLSELKALCGWSAPQDQPEGRRTQRNILSTVLGILVGAAFEDSQELDTNATNRRLSLLCCSLLDDMLSWVLDTLDDTQSVQSDASAAEIWIQLFDASLCGVSVAPEALHRFFTHSLTHALTYKPRLTVSEAIAMQNGWSFAKSSRLLISIFRKLAVILSVEKLLCHLQQVMETHEINWQHVLCFLSTLLVYNPYAQPSLKELLSRLLSSAFESYDLEYMITAFLLARQGAIEGPAFFPSYSDWFKVSFGGASGYHGHSKKSLVFLLKFLSDLVPFDPPQYLKVHILHPPYVAVKHRSLLLEYISLAKTRLADLKVSVENMGLYEDVSGAAGPSVQPECQSLQDVQKAVSLFESTGRISATVMEASIFRRPYFLTRFLPALLTPRLLPVKADAQMSFIEALRKADKIPAAQYTSYVESCQKQRQHNKPGMHVESSDDPVVVVTVQLQDFRQMVIDGNDGEVSAQVSRISHTLGVIFPDHPEERVDLQTAIKLNVESHSPPEPHKKVVNMILRNFCQCIVDVSQANPPNRQSLWASQFVSVLLGHTQLASALLHRLWDLFHHQGSSLSAAHVPGLAVLVVHLHASKSQSPLVQTVSSSHQQLLPPTPVPIAEALSCALTCSTHTHMLFCVRLCVAAVCYGLCRADAPSQIQDYVPSSLYKKLLYLIPRLMPEARRIPISSESAGVSVAPEGLVDQSVDPPGLWGTATHPDTTWRSTAWQMWTHPAFQQLGQLPQYQLVFEEWLSTELRVQRNEDILTDPERQEYQQWACLELYLPRPVELGGCGGDTRTLCSHILNAIMDQQLRGQRQAGEPHHRPSQTGTCLPDILSRLQELVYDMRLTDHYNNSSSSSRGGGGSRDHAPGHFLFELLSQRCSSSSSSSTSSSSSSSSSSTSQSISRELDLQHTLQTWNRMLLALPAAVFVCVRSQGGVRTLHCQTLLEHVNQHQRKVCSPAGLLPYHITAHFLRGVLSASVSCDHPSGEVNKVWAQITLHCPLLLLSTVHWWSRLSPVLTSQWHHLMDREPLPEQLQLVADCHQWACSSVKAAASQMPPGPALLLAGCLHCAWGRGVAAGQKKNQSFRAALETLGPVKERQYKQVLVFLFYLCVTDLLSTLLYPQEVSKDCPGVRELCTAVLTRLVDSPDWLLVFKCPTTEQALHQAVTMVTPDEYTRLMPLAFYSLLLGQSAELLDRAARCPGFLHTAVLCYSSLLTLFLDGKPSSETTETTADQMDLTLVLRRAQQFLLRTISQSSSTALSSSQLCQLESQFSTLDPELAAALHSHFSSDCLSQEMDLF